MRNRERNAPAVDEASRIRLADVIEMVNDTPAPQLRVVVPVDKLPKAQHHVYAPLPQAPGATELAVAPGSPMPPGTELMHSLTTELLERFAAWERFDQRDAKIAGWRHRLDELDEFEREIAAQRSRVHALIAEQEAIEPVEPIDWQRVSEAIWKVTGFVPVGDRALPSWMQVIPASDNEEAWHHEFGFHYDRLGRKVTKPPTVTAARTGKRWRS